MDKVILERAKLAAKRTTIDTIAGIATCIKMPECYIPSTTIAWEGRERRASAKDRVIARVPDLLDLAVYAWYKLQEETKNNEK